MLDWIKVWGVRRCQDGFRSVDFCIVLLKERTTEGRAYVLKDNKRTALLALETTPYHRLHLSTPFRTDIVYNSLLWRGAENPHLSPCQFLLHYTRHYRLPVESPQQSNPCVPMPIGAMASRVLALALVAPLLATS